MKYEKITFNKQTTEILRFPISCGIKNKKGFTIIEMMISIGIFLIVVTIGMTALLNASSIHNKLQDTHSTLDSLNFMMDDMSKNIRTGYSYYCVDVNSSVPADWTTLSGSQQNCSRANGYMGQALSFTSPNLDGTTSQIVYYFDSNGNLEKWVDGGSPVQLNPDGVVFTSMASGGDGGTGFWVYGSDESGPTDYMQPFVTIVLNGTITSKGVSTPFSLQTSVSQRLNDI